MTDYFDLDVMYFQVLRICLCYIVLYPIFEQISFNSDAVKEYNILKGACSYMHILRFVFDFFFCSYFVYMEKVEDIVCKREINYFGGLPLE